MVIELICVKVFEYIDTMIYLFFRFHLHVLDTGHNIQYLLNLIKLSDNLSQILEIA